jgi:hypothetical protein
MRLFPRTEDRKCFFYVRFNLIHSVGLSVGLGKAGVMGKLTAISITRLKELGRYSDGEGLNLRLAAPAHGSWILRVQANGKRSDIGLRTLPEIELGEARDAAREFRKKLNAKLNMQG